MKLFEENARVLENAEVRPGCFRMILACEDIACTAAPGQFVMVGPGGALHPLLRRPFSVHDVLERGDGTSALALLYQVVGMGTRNLSHLKPGDELPVLGPLGKGFTHGDEAAASILVGGGIGSAPLVFLARLLAQEMSSGSCMVLLGGRTRNHVLGLDAFKALGLDVRIATEDGSMGSKGLVTDLLAEALPREGGARIYTCGPMPMLKAVTALARERNTPCQVSVETVMACGMGACLGCALKQKGQNGKHLHACMDGPVMDARRLWT